MNTSCPIKDCKERLGDRVSSMETRKIVFPTERMLGQKNALKEALWFEDFFLRFKLKYDAGLSRSEQEHLSMLKKRL